MIRSFARRALPVVAAAFVACGLVQVFLAGLGVFDDPASFVTHREFGYLLGWFTLAMLVLALLGRERRLIVGLTVLVLVQFTFQSVFVALRTTYPAVAALHPVNGFLLLVVGIAIARLSWVARREPAGARGSVPASASATERPIRRDRGRLTMADGVAVAGWLLVAGTILGLAPVANPSLLRVWLVSRAEHIAIVGAHRRAWYTLNAGFAAATVATIAGLGVLDRRHRRGRHRAGGPHRRDRRLRGRRRAVVRHACDPFAGDARPRRTSGQTRRARRLPARRGAGRPVRRVRPHDGRRPRRDRHRARHRRPGVGSSSPSRRSSSALLALVIQLATGDLVPAVLYLPTLAIGIALLVGWT